MRTLWTALTVLSVTISISRAATVERHYFAHDMASDRNGVIAQWYRGQNGQCDFRVRIAAETLKRYPWTTKDRAVGIAPEYAFNPTWQISSDGQITIPPLKDYTDGDRGQMCGRALEAWVEYYRYSGDPAAMAHIEGIGNVLLDHTQTDSKHSWPNFLISVPVKGKAYGQADPGGWIQLDIVGEAGLGLLHAYQLTGNKRYFEAVKHWADVFVEKRNRKAGQAPWGRYANPDNVEWCKSETGNIQTGGVIYQLAMFDELIRLGYTGKHKNLVEARDAARAYVRDVLLPLWTVNDTWGRNYWDWEDYVQSQTTTDCAARYLMDNKDYFKNWKNDVRNILTIFLNHTSVDPVSRGEVYSGAWAFPESNGCCTTSLAWAPMEFALDFARYGVEAKSEWSTEMARRQQILATYDALNTGVAEDNILGGSLSAGGWLKGTHVSVLEMVIQTMGWMPDVFGAPLENHIMRSSAVVNSVVYAKGKIAYTTFDAPENTVDVLRLAFEPKSIKGAGKSLKRRDDLNAKGFTVEPLSQGDFIVSIRHDGCTDIVVEGDDPQNMIDDPKLTYEGEWTTVNDKNAWGGTSHSATAAEAGVTCIFTGNQVRVIADVGPDGGLADVYLDDDKQLVGIDFWNPKEIPQQIVYYRNGMSGAEHTLKIVAAGKGNPLSKGKRINIDAVQFLAAEVTNTYGEGGGPRDAQRMIFGYTNRTDYVDKQGNAWRPGTEFVVRTGNMTDSVAKSWWTKKRADAIEAAADPELYEYGAHFTDITINLTVGPGVYDLNLKFAETEFTEAGKRLMNIDVNTETVKEGLDVFAAAGKANKAFDLAVKKIVPRNGIIEIRLSGQMIKETRCEAMLQALELTPSK